MIWSFIKDAKAYMEEMKAKPEKKMNSLKKAG